MFDTYTAEYFELRNATRNTRAYINDIKFIRKCLKTTNVQASTAIDYGCGEMLFTKYLQGVFAKVFVYDASEHIQEMEEYKMRQFTANVSCSPLDSPLLVLRGLLQHLPEPYTTLKDIAKTNTPNLIFFLSVPNSRSIYYLLNETLPCLDPDNNYYIPSPRMLEGLMRRVGYELVAQDFPYLRSGYAKPGLDHARFLINLTGMRRCSGPYPFWGSMFNACYKRL